MSIFNIEIDFVRDSERIIRISRISFWVETLTILIGLLIVVFWIFNYLNRLLDMPLYIVFYTIAMMFLIISSTKIYVSHIKFSEIRTDKVKNEMKDELAKKGRNLLISGILILIVLGSISLLLPHYENLSYHLVQGQSITLKPQLNFQSANINGMWISGTGTTMVISQDGSRIVLNDSSVNPSNEIYLAQGESYIVQQIQGNSNLVVQYSGNYIPYYLSILLSVTSLIPALYWVIRLRR